MREPTDREAPDAEPLDGSGDDAVIGRALKRSLLAVVVLAFIVAAALWLARRPQRTPPEQLIETAPPVEVERVAEPPAVQFTDITRSAGIDFVHFNGAAGSKLLPETMGGGGAFFDYDGDGDQDLFIVNGAPWPGDPSPARRPTAALYRNDGSGKFERVTATGDLDRPFYGMGVAAADYDGDGRVDLFVTAVGSNRLYRNAANGFEDVTTRAGVGGAADAWSTAATFVDLDRDGDLDLFVGNYVRWSPQIDYRVDYRLTGIGRAYGPPLNYEGTYPYLYRNNGDGTFSDASAEAGIRVDNPATGEPVAKTLSVAPVDLDADGWIDLVVANDTVRNFLFHNLGDGSFEEIGEISGLAYDRNGAATGAMGLDSGHFRNDSEIGFLMGNFANEMTSVYVSQGDASLFVDEAITEGIGAPTRTVLSFGVFLFDYDLDGRLDLLQSNGHLEEQINDVDPSQRYAQAPQLFWNAGPDAPRTFVEVDRTSTGDMGRAITGRGSAYADIDGDGDLDVLLLQVGGPPLLLRNDQAIGNHWVRLRLIGPPGNRAAIGARIELESGGVTQRRQVMPTKSYLSQSEVPLTFGLGDADSIDSISVLWPDGSRQSVEPHAIDAQVMIEYSDRNVPD